jgi:all-trans-8'-apo-beta-carotenal 15,15'-oxygenase
MQRRQFLQTTAAALAASTALSAPAFAAPDSWQAQFAAELERQPWLLGFRTASASSFNAQATLSGTIPAELSGTLYRNGPARHEIGNYRSHHWFDGDGMIQAYRINPDGISHQAQMIATRKYLAETDAGRALYPGITSVPPNPRPVTSPDTVNVANISVLPHHGKLYALWEAGSPWEIDSDTLTTEGIHSFSAETKGLPFSAHPRIEPDGNLWNFGYVSGAGKLVFWHIQPNGKLGKVGMVDCDPMGMPHDFVVTENHLVILIPPFHFEPEGATAFLDAHQWHPERPTRVLVVDKNDFSQHRFLELPAQWIFHYGNAYEESDGSIRFDAARAADPLVMIDSFSAVMKGQMIPGTDATHYSYRIDLKKGQVTETPLLDKGIASEFPVIDPRVSGRRYSSLFMLTASRSAHHGMLNEVSSFNLNSGRLDTYEYPDTIIPEEHLFVPAPGSALESAGWVIGSALNYQQARTELRIFDAAHLSEGPLATASLPYALPLGLHGKFA